MKQRLDALEDENRRLEKALRALELDWSEWFNKFRLLYARLTKRIKDEEAREDAPGHANGERPDSDDHRDELVHHRLSQPAGNWNPKGRRNY